jgi:hypothetical protein
MLKKSKQNLELSRKLQEAREAKQRQIQDEELSDTTVSDTLAGEFESTRPGIEELLTIEPEEGAAREGTEDQPNSCKAVQS